MDTGVSLIRLVDEFAASDRKEIRRILALPGLLDSFCPSAVVDVDSMTNDWCKPPLGHGDFVALARTDDGHILGSIGLEKNVLSYFVDPQYWGHGYGKFMVQWVLENILRNRPGDCIHASTLRSNLASIRILENAGFRFSGLFVEHFNWNTMLNYELRV